MKTKYIVRFDYDRMVKPNDQGGFTRIAGYRGDLPARGWQVLELANKKSPLVVAEYALEEDAVAKAAKLNS